MAENADDLAHLEAQRVGIEQLFEVAPPGPPRTLTEAEYEEASRLVAKSGWTALDRQLLQAVKSGAKPGDSIPPAEPHRYVRGIDNIVVRVVDREGERRVAVFFDHVGFPGVRFAHLWGAPDPTGEKLSVIWYEEVWFQEEMETGRLHWVMRWDNPTYDEDGVVWTRMHGGLIGLADESDLDKLFLRSIVIVEKTLDGSSCGIYVAAEDQPRPCRQRSVVRAAARLWDDRWTPSGPPPPTPGYVGACEVHADELGRRVEEREGVLEQCPRP